MLTLVKLFHFDLILYIYIYVLNIYIKIFLLTSHTCHNSLLIEFWGLFLGNIDKMQVIWLSYDVINLVKVSSSRLHLF